ncbi:filamentous hemagglutinin N-terminal domain-containing protein [Burkholderia sp. THE68]|uniref:two-partner secretion domain-containing protein n=1 Tax=Burkholderia sp. THE68 TaxID=758782 RepID=UPI00138A07F5|nr:filamentous hemagglutinin N-terminal domain-containing protein [Burkholderia sp. THE68]
MMRITSRARRSATLRRASFAAAGLLAGAAAFVPDASGHPTGSAVVGGHVSVTGANTSNMVINQTSDRAAMQFDNFTINQGESVRILQPGTSSMLLGRVIGPDRVPSNIDGTLSATGGFILVNPAGVAFSRSAAINVGSLVASSLDITPEAFMAAKNSFTFSGKSGGPVTNAAVFSAAQGGTVALLGGQVRNDGTISARLGTVALASGGAVTLDFAGDGLTKITVNDGILRSLVTNGPNGRLLAEGGQIVLSAHDAEAFSGAVVNQQGYVSALSIQQRNGHVVLDGGANGVTQIEGEVDASGGSFNPGGRIDVLGNNISLLTGSHVNARGTSGGVVNITGSNAIWMAPGAFVDAYGLGASGGPGNGGQIFVQAANTARLYGSFDASAAERGGNGGSLHTSAHFLDASNAHVYLGAPNGQGGTWHVNAAAIDIAASGTPGTTAPQPGTQPDFSAGSGPSLMLNTAINEQLNRGTSVTLSTSGWTQGGAVAPGDIDVNAPVSKTDGGDATLQLQSAGSIRDGAAAIGSTKGKLNVVLDANVEDLGTPQSIRFGTQETGASIFSNQGDVQIGSRPQERVAVAIQDSIFDTRAGGSADPATGSDLLKSGAITIHGQGSGATLAPTGSSDTRGPAAIALYGATLRTSSGAIDIEATPGAGTKTPTSGVVISTLQAQQPGPLAANARRSVVRSASGTVQISGIGTDPTGAAPTQISGVRIMSGTTVQSDTSSIDIRGGLLRPAGTKQPIADRGLALDASTLSATGDGARISLTGESSNNDYGLLFSSYLDNVESGGPNIVTGKNGTVILRALNNGTSDSVAFFGNVKFTTGANSALAILPGGVFTPSGSATASATPINLFSSGPGLSLDATTLKQTFAGFDTIAIGSPTQTGRITVYSDCAGGACRPTLSNNLTLNASGVNSQGISLGSGLATPGKTLTLQSSGKVTDPGGIAANALMLSGPGIFTLDDKNNEVNVIAFANAGNVTFTNAHGFSIGSMISRTFDPVSGRFVNLDATNSTLTGSLLAQALLGGITLGGGTGVPAGTSGPTGSANTSLSSKGTIQLAMENGQFRNAGTGTISSDDAWRIYALNWQGEVRGAVKPGPDRPNFYGCTLSGGCSWGGAVPAKGNHFVYVEQPSVTVTAQDVTSLDGNPVPPFTASVSGLVNGDTRAGALTEGYTTSPAIRPGAGSYTINPTYTSPVGYKIVPKSGTLTVLASRRGGGDHGGDQPPIPQALPGPGNPPRNPETLPGNPPNNPVVDPLGDTDPSQPSALAGLQTLFSSREETFVYENNLQGQTQVCIASNQPEFFNNAPGEKADPLAVEWKRVRAQPNLNHCVSVTRKHGCDDF